MNLLEIRSVVAGPRVFVDGTDPIAGTVVRTTIYSGYVALASSAGFRGAVRADDLQPITFFVPDSLPYPQPPTTIGVELSVRRFKSTGAAHCGACDEQVTAVPDPRGGAHHWLQLSFRTPIYSVNLVELNYRLTVCA
jgi:hypothetical protein